MCTHAHAHTRSLVRVVNFSIEQDGDLLSKSNDLTSTRYDDCVSFFFFLSFILTKTPHSNLITGETSQARQKKESMIRVSRLFCLCLSVSLSLFLFLSLTYRGNKRRGEGIVREAEQYASLADAGVADEEQFEQQVVRLLRHLGAGIVPGRRGTGAYGEVNRSAGRAASDSRQACNGRRFIAIGSATMILRGTPILRTSNVTHRLCSLKVERGRVSRWAATYVCNAYTTSRVESYAGEPVAKRRRTIKRRRDVTRRRQSQRNTEAIGGINMG